MQELIQLIYLSQIDADSLNSDMVKSILISAKKNNSSRQITGMLVFDYNHFLQVLEGPADEVHALYKVISADPRHKNVRKVKDESVTQRQFGSWSMGFSQTSKKVESLLGSDAIDPEKALALLLNEAQGCGNQPVSQQV